MPSLVLDVASFLPAATILTAMIRWGIRSERAAMLAAREEQR